MTVIQYAILFGLVVVILALGMVLAAPNDNLMLFAVACVAAGFLPALWIGLVLGRRRS